MTGEVRRAVGITLIAGAGAVALFVAFFNLGILGSWAPVVVVAIAAVVALPVAAAVARIRAGRGNPPAAGPE